MGPSTSIAISKTENYAVAPSNMTSAPNCVAPRKTILVIDDEDGVREVLSASLRLKGYRPITASCGAEGLALFRSEKIDAVIVDMRMPDMHGKEVIAHLRGIDPDVRVLGISGYDSGSNFPWAEAQQFTLLNKPFSPKELWSAVEQLFA
jgi:DNA-binding NtrC family response regulator